MTRDAMNRRKFLRRTVPVTVLPMLMGGFTFKAYGRGPILQALVGAPAETDHVLVLVQLNGGNDGLNTVIPLDQYSELMAARSNIAIPEGLVYRINDATGLHPSLTGLGEMCRGGLLSVIQSVGYPSPNFSHFRATDIWLTASDANVVMTSGWLGRYLDQEYPDYPVGYPNTGTPDPLALQIGSVVSLGLQGPEVSMGMALTSPTSFYQMVTGAVDEAPATPAGHELTFIRQVAQQTEQYATVITAAAGKATNLSPLYPAAGTNGLADQLKIVAQLIAGGLKTRIYVVNLGGFDTHSAQVSATGGTDTGNHATLLQKLNDAILAFQDDCHRLGIERRVVGMTFSEFGRRIKSNASLGTDHGSAAPVFVFGQPVRGGVIGLNPVLPDAASSSDNIPMAIDFRSVYATLLREWFNVPQAELEAVLLNQYASLPLIFKKSPDSKLPIISSATADVPLSIGLGQNYPNPFNPSTTIPFTTDGAAVSLVIYNALGQQVMVLADGTYPAGRHEARFDAGDLPAGAYYCRFESGGHTQTRTLLLLK
jgi:uncharacterized protein (DUF1501 family)